LLSFSLLLKYRVLSDKKKRTSINTNIKYKLKKKIVYKNEQKQFITVKYGLIFIYKKSKLLKNSKIEKIHENIKKNKENQLKKKLVNKYISVMFTMLLYKND